MLDELLLEINALAKKKREQGLTPQEQKRQKELYSEYLSIFRGNMKKQLDNIDVEFEDGKVVPLSDLKKNKD